MRRVCSSRLVTCRRREAGYIEATWPSKPLLSHSSWPGALVGGDAAIGYVCRSLQNSQPLGRHCKVQVVRALHIHDRYANNLSPMIKNGAAAVTGQNVCGNLHSF